MSKKLSKKLIINKFNNHKLNLTFKLVWISLMIIAKFNKILKSKKREKRKILRSKGGEERKTQ